MALLGITVFLSAESKTDMAMVREANFTLAGKFTEIKLREMLKDTAVSPNWISGTRRFWYQFRTMNETTFILVDSGKKLKSPLIDREYLARELGRLTGKSVDYRNLPVSRMELIESGQILRFAFEKKSFRYHLTSRGLEEKKGSEQKSELFAYGTYSPDGRIAAYTRDYNLYLRECTAGSREVRLTRDSVCYYGFDDSDYDYVDAEEQDPGLRREGFVVWSPDSKKFLALRTDARHLKSMKVMNSLSRPRPSIITYKVSLADEEVRTYELWIYNHGLGKMIRVEAQRWPGQEYGDFSWSRDSSRLFLVRKSKNQLRCDLLSVDPETGKTTVLIRERNAGMILTQPVTELEGSGDLIWYSRRNGFGNYYLYNSLGKYRTALTRGRFNASRILRVDEKEGMVYFQARGDNGDGNPYYTHLYKVRIGNGELTRLTREEAHHQVQLSPDGGCFVDNFSRADMAPRSLLRDMNGRIILELERADMSRLNRAGWEMPMVFREKAADACTDIWGIMWKPFDWKPGKRYPVVTFVYPGPQDEFIPWHFFGRPENAHLAQYGFVVLMFGNRGGSQLRSLKYGEFYRGNLRDYGIEDKKVVIENLAEKYPFMDIDRVGIWGGSSGGYMTVTAMLLYPDFFKVGVSRSGVQDPGLMYRWWGDSFHGMKEIRDADGRIKLKSLKVPSNLEIASNLKGRLLLIQGEADTIVPPANAIRLADVLMKLNKRFDFILVPGGGHGASQHWNYIKNRVWLYFIENLMGDRRFQNCIDLPEFIGENQ